MMKVSIWQRSQYLALLIILAGCPPMVASQDGMGPPSIEGIVITAKKLENPITHEDDNKDKKTEFYFLLETANALNDNPFVPDNPLREELKKIILPEYAKQFIVAYEDKNGKLIVMGCYDHGIVWCF